MIIQPFVRHAFGATLTLVISLLVACALVACGGATSTKDAFTPSRVVVFGDAQSVRSGGSGSQFTVNGSGAVDNWTNQVAANYGVTSFAGSQAGNALLAAVANQVSAFGRGHQTTDMTLISAGYRDIIDLAQGVSVSISGTCGDTTLTGNIQSACRLGSQYADIVRSLVSNGALHVGVLNMHDFSTSYAANGGTASAATMKSLIRAFNDGLKGNLGNTSSVNVGEAVRLLDAEYYHNLVLAAPTSYGFTDATSVSCPAGGTSIGFGTKSSSTCTTTNASASFSTYVYADPVYWTPAMHRAAGGYVYSLLRARW